MKVIGSCSTRVPSCSPSMASMCSGSRVKSNTSRFSATRSGLDDRETTTLSSCRFHRTSTCAGVRPYSAAIVVTVGSSISRPTPNGL